MQIWIDGDACPKAIKTILFNAANRTKTNLIIVSNHFVNIPASPFIKRWMVGAGFDVADQKIIDHVEPNDLVITADIPLADAILSKNAIALNPRGKLYSASNIKHILAMRNINETLRDSGMISGGAAAMSSREVQEFSNHLDRILSSSK